MLGNQATIVPVPAKNLNKHNNWCSHSFMNVTHQTITYEWNQLASITPH
jgi:hypothetical protein